MLFSDGCLPVEGDMTTWRRAEPLPPGREWIRATPCDKVLKGSREREGMTGMLDYLAAIGIGTLVFGLFMLAFLKRDAGGQRGARLGGCRHHHSEQVCERCRGGAPETIRPRVSDGGE